VSAAAEGQLYAYAVLRAEDALAATAGDAEPGLGGGKVGVVRAGGLAALVGPVDAGEIPRTRRNMMAHLKVLEGAMRAGPLLPMRFGVVAPDAEAIARRVAGRERELSALLDRHEGVAEFGLRVCFPRDVALAATIAAHPDLARRRAALRAASPVPQLALAELGRAVAEALDGARKRAERALMAALRPLARDAVLRAPESDVEALRAEFLLPLAEADAFAAEAARAAAGLPFAPGAAPEVRVVGPAPAYNFVSLSLDDAAAAA
jgi:hypothetical protein